MQSISERAMEIYLSGKGSLKEAYEQAALERTDPGTADILEAFRKVGINL